MIGGIKRVQARAGAEAEFEAALREFSALVRAHEPGTLSFELFRDGAPGRYVVLDRYRDGDALAAHNGSPHGAIWFPRIRALLDRLEVSYFPGHEPGETKYTAAALTRAPWERAFRLAADISLLPRWATRFCQEIRAQGDVRFRYEADAAGRVIWHCAGTGSGELRMPMRVLPHGPGSLLLFTIQRPPGCSEAAFGEQIEWVDQALGQLRELVEAP
ncbi:antibiotic biosynthesis monooxygenase [Polyangium sp. 15x6]|uniref:putative quinol monooxygenase n=1 Tax=Polyangium sp. 15x6 TaxID=3042687 RepID=UPI002499CA75|nr:antibiotic biosynthesis monooxygenase [Polyangium sp. 15x6]MDI3289903.1 antibiotic biosynthesis monooxygenase [Polyangium sp. 15x6]